MNPDVWPVQGHSMWPLLRPGDTVELRWGQTPRLGDLAVTPTAQGLVLHRVVARRDGRWQLKGDARLAFDPPSDRILAVAEARWRGGRRQSLRRLPLHRLLVAWSRLGWPWWLISRPLLALSPTPLEGGGGSC